MNFIVVLWRFYEFYSGFMNFIVVFMRLFWYEV